MTTLPAPHKPHPESQESPATEAPHRRGRLWRRMLTALVLTALVVFLAGGWYFSGRIESGALASTPAAYLPGYDDVEVVSVTEDPTDTVLMPKGVITLRKGPDVSANFASPGSYALAWDGGTGHVGPATLNADGTVTRDLTVVTCNYPEAGQLAALDRSYWVGDPPTGLGLTLKVSGSSSLQRVTIGTNPAWYFTGRDATLTPDTVVVVVHGQNGNRLDGLRIVDVLSWENAQIGDPVGDLPVLVVSYRNDVGAQPDPSGRLQYGQTEWQDLDQAVGWVLDQGARRVVLVGQSMGAAVVAAFLENSQRADSVSGVVLDSPQLSLDETVRYGAREALPGGRPVPEPVLWLAQRLASLRFGVDWTATDYLDDTSWLRVPTLLLHGTADPTVPVTTARRLAQSKPDLVELVEFPAALHVESWNFDREHYETVLRAFVTDRLDQPR